jgi:hypothetical protein
MLGIDPPVMVHKLNVDPKDRSVKQKRRSYTPEQNIAAAEEVEKLLQVGFIKEIYYPNWLANVVMVKKVQRKMEVVRRLQ